MVYIITTFLHELLLKQKFYFSLKYIKLNLFVYMSYLYNFCSCNILELNGTSYCEWNYNGLGFDYQILAGPSFIAIFTIVGVFLGIAADKYNRFVK